MIAYDSPMTVGKMPNGQPCIRLPRGLVATMEAGSDATREADAAEVARRWNAAPDLLGFARLVAALEDKCRSEGGRHPTYAEWAVLATSIPAIARATGGGA